MNCQYKKTVAGYWSVEYRFTRNILESCTYPAKWKLRFTISKKRGEETWFVCGVHRRSIRSHARLLGYFVKEERITQKD